MFETHLMKAQLGLKFFFSFFKSIIFINSCMFRIDQIALANIKAIQCAFLEEIILG
jgi:hypothetical protein